MFFTPDKKCKNFSKRLLGLALAASIFVAAPREAAAQCEVPGTTMATAGGIVASQTAAITAMTTTLTTLYITTTTASSATMISLLEGMENIIQARMRKFWEDWEDALKSMTIQVNAGVADQSRQMSSLFDSSNLTDTARTLQRAEVQAHQTYAPTEAGCRFDTFAISRSQAGRVSRAMSTALAAQMTDYGNAKAGTPAASGGQGAVLKSRFDTYRSRFCDSDSNGGGAACGSTSAAAPNAHILPSVTLFGKETLDMTDENTRVAVTELAYNITGYQPPATIDPKVLESPQGKESRQNNRGYLAQMDAVNALIFSIVGERTPVQSLASESGGEVNNSQYVQQMRQRMGIGNASANASEREIRQAVMEQLWDPSFYVNLTTDANGISQQEVFLQAYNLMLLYRMQEKVEKISNAYAIEAGNMLDKKYESKREGGRRYVPVGN